MISRKSSLLICSLCVLKLVLSRSTGDVIATSTNFSHLTQNNNNGNPSSEIFGGNIYRKAASENGMDPDAVAEVVRTGRPFIKIENGENGTKRTTTYTLQPDGSISRHIKTEYRPVVISSTGPNLSANTQFTTIPNVPTLNGSPSQKGSDWEWNPSNIPQFRSTANDLDDRPTTWHINTEPFSSDKTHTTLPSLEDFLKSQYGTTTKKPNYSKNSPTVSTTFTPTPLKPVTTINISDLPAVEVLNTRSTLGSYVPDLSTPNIRTHTKTYTSTIQTNGTPKASDFDPSIKEILDKAGINPEDVLNSNSGTVTKTTHAPDGSVIRTTYSVRTMPSRENAIGSDTNKISYTLNDKNIQGPFPIDEHAKTTNRRIGESHTNSMFPAVYPPNISIRPHDVETSIPFNTNWSQEFSRKIPSTHVNSKPKVQINPIDEFLSKLDLTSEMLTATNGEITKTILDNDGRVLTASFVLSTVRNNEKSIKSKEERVPIKRFA